MEDEYEDNPIEENPSEFIKKAAEERAMNLQREAHEREILQRQAMQSIIDRKIRDNQRKVQEQKKIANNGTLKGFVRNKFVFEIKRGLTIYNLYVKDKTFLLENSKTGYTSCSSNLENIKGKAEKLLIV